MKDFLNLFPMRKCGYEIKNNLVIIEKTIENPTFIEKIFFKKLINTPHKIDLDEYGSYVWNKCDGSLNVYEIAEQFKNDFDENIERHTERTVEFIKTLYKNRLIELYTKTE